MHKTYNPIAQKLSFAIDYMLSTCACCFLQSSNIVSRKSFFGVMWLCKTKHYKH